MKRGSAKLSWRTFDGVADASDAGSVEIGLALVEIALLRQSDERFRRVWEQGEEALHAVGVVFAVARQLPAERAELAAQRHDAGGEEVGERISTSFRRLMWVTELVALHAEDEAFRRRGGPVGEAFWLLVRVEGGVDLDIAECRLE